jgi:uncharacterized protein YegP (UPF0339 family)
MNKVIVYKDRKGFWRWQVRARNGKIRADSGEGYNRQKDCINGFIGIVNKPWEVVVKKNK